MRRLLNKKAQSTAEYAIVIALIVGTVIFMQTYTKRGLQGRVKDAVDGLVTWDGGFGIAGHNDITIDESMGALNYSGTDYMTAQKGPAQDNVYLEGRTVTSITGGDTFNTETESTIADGDGAVKRESLEIEQRDVEEDYDYTKF